MGQSPSTTTSRHDNASTRTLHSTSMNSNRPLSFFRRISNRLSPHPNRRFGQHRADIVTEHASSTTSSVRRATQEAARAAAAVTGPPTSFLLQTPPHSSSRNSVTSSDSTNTSAWNELLSSRESESGGGILRHLQIPLRVQQEINASMEDIPQSSGSSTTTRMHILVIEYRTANDNLPSLPTYRFLGLRRPRSQVSSNSSTDTIQSMPLSLSNNNNNNNNNNTIQEGGQWVVYVMNNQHAFQALSSSVLEDNPTYEDLLLLSSMLGPVRPSTTTQAAIDEAIPVIDWTEQLKDESCLVCLDDFKLKQPVRVLKCHHVFHRECVDRWLCESHNSCPVCRGVPVETQ